jgi:antitoxin StbD
MLLMVRLIVLPLALANNSGNHHGTPDTVGNRCKHFRIETKPDGNVVAIFSPVAILNRNEPAFYCVPPAFAPLEHYIELNALADARAGQKRVKVRLDEL